MTWLVVDVSNDMVPNEGKGKGVPVLELVVFHLGLKCSLEDGWRWFKQKVGQPKCGYDPNGPFLEAAC